MIGELGSWGFGGLGGTRGIDREEMVSGCAGDLSLRRWDKARIASRSLESTDIAHCATAAPFPFNIWPPSDISPHQTHRSCMVARTKMVLEICNREVRQASYSNLRLFSPPSFRPPLQNSSYSPPPPAQTLNPPPPLPPFPPSPTHQPPTSPHSSPSANSSPWWK